MSDDRIQTVEQVAADTNAITVTDAVRQALVSDLGPVAERIPMYEQQAEAFRASQQSDADAGAELCEQIARDIKLVKDQDVLTKITTGLHGLHKRWVALREAFVGPMEQSRKTVRSRILAWQESERLKAEALERKLQAEADERARRERERLEREAAKLKTEEKREERLERAAAVVAPTVTVAKPSVTMRGVARVWKVAAVNEDAFYAALAQDRTLRGYVAIDTTRIQRAKSANPALEVAGVKFEHVLR